MQILKKREGGIDARKSNIIPSSAEVMFLHRVATFGRDRHKDGSDRNPVLLIRPSDPGHGQPDCRAELSPHAIRHLHGDGRVDRTAFGEQPRVDSQHRGFDISRIHDHSPDHSPRCPSRIHESRHHEPAREGFGHGDRFARENQLFNQPLDSAGGHVIHRTQPRIAFHTYSSPVHTVSASAAAIRLPFTQFIQSPSRAGNGARAKDTAMDWAVVLTLPPHDAA